jgi:hypothetical protein
MDYLVWMPVATVVSLFVVLFAYGLFASALAPFPKHGSRVLTGLLLAAWPAWVVLLAWNAGNDTSPRVKVLAGLAFAIPTIAVLALVLNFINGCAGDVFPLGGSGYCR